MSGWTDEKIITLIRSKLSADRFNHSLNVADSAKELALSYGADADKAYTAGLLHDVMKNASEEEQLGVLSEAGIELMPVERENKKLWHAIAGAAYVKFVMGIDDRDIIRAVRYHTTGRSGMSLIERIVYLADYISADRNYNGVEDMRRLCKSDSDEAILYALTFGIPDLVSKGRVIHPDSIDLYNEVIIKKQGGNGI
ncbi:MAG: bis(5'-nucleosyl)-tetraphosphatase (symmetrical) YqeK [Oscillospiraceae bacterium]|nr:bis(5'-nucleosyl)-tetraphosphatase (symmetrical) YqeK [Clostridiaceae bacterium]MDY5890013.1 bis(5'-nucleosyl)-tetraphosphatase (symmetrical) YqeK [Oscillospiraceae bacterium]MDY5934022.1 bis(5'-nucleosyl)-tetraphosphatase (symmetrical) YqeK [Oscillospiraceae bacterium]